MNRILLIAAALAVVTGCAQALERRVANSLVEAGLSQSVANCMAKRWTDRLSAAQIKKISDLAEDVKREGRDLTAVGFINRVQAMDDPEIVSVVTRSSISCALTA